MSQVLAVVFEGAQDAAEARSSLRELEALGRLALDDAAVVVKTAEGNIQVQNEPDATVVSGAVWGGVLGLLLSFMFPIAGLAIGAIGGAIVGKMLDSHVDKGFITDVSTAMKAGNSALFLIIRDSDPAALVTALKPFKGSVFQTSISPELEASLKDVLKD